MLLPTPVLDDAVRSVYITVQEEYAPLVQRYVWQAGGDRSRFDEVDITLMEHIIVTTIMRTSPMEERRDLAPAEAARVAKIAPYEYIKQLMASTGLMGHHGGPPPLEQIIGPAPQYPSESGIHAGGASVGHARDLAQNTPSRFLDDTVIQKMCRAGKTAHTFRRRRY